MILNFKYLRNLSSDWCLENCDQKTENCVSTSTGFQCECKDGYSGTPCVGPGLENKNLARQEGVYFVVLIKNSATSVIGEVAVWASYFTFRAVRLQRMHFDRAFNKER